MGNGRADLGDGVSLSLTTDRVAIPSVAEGLRLLDAFGGGPAFLGSSCLLASTPLDRRGSHRRDCTRELDRKKTDGVVLRVHADSSIAMLCVVSIDLTEDVGDSPALVIDVMSFQDLAEMADVLPT